MVMYGVDRLRSRAPAAKFWRRSGSVGIVMSLRLAGTDIAKYVMIAVPSRATTEAVAPAVLVAALAVGRSPAEGTIILAGLTGLAAIGGPFIGATQDRARRPGRVTTAAIVVLAAGVALLALLLPTAPVVVLVAIACVGGIAQPALTGGLTAQLPDLVPASSLTRAYGLDAATYNIGAIAGPPLAAACVVFGPVYPLLFTLGLLGVALLIRPFIPFAEREHRLPRHSMWRDFTTGFQGLIATPTLAAATTISTIGFAGQSAFLVAVPLIALNLTGSLAAAGLIFGASAIGGIISSGWISVRPIGDTDRTMIVSTIIVTFALVLMAIVHAFALVVLLAFVLGLADGPLLTATFAIRTREAPAKIRSQVFTTGASVKTTSYALTTAVFGLLAGLGPTAILLLGAAIQLLAIGSHQLIERRGFRSLRAG